MWQGDPCTKGRGPRGGHKAGRAGAHHDQVVAVGGLGIQGARWVDLIGSKSRIGHLFESLPREARHESGHGDRGDEPDAE